MVDTFTRTEFEAALPAGRWMHAGIILGEHCYMVRVTGYIRIMIRSSIAEDGISRGSGEDSIRLMLIDIEGQPVAPKFKRWTTRVPGWQERMLEHLRFMWRVAQRIGHCEHCNSPRKMFRVLTNAKGNRGRYFLKCDNCDKLPTEEGRRRSFKWFDSFTTQDGETYILWEKKK
jgi:hypothetical protein